MSPLRVFLQLVLTVFVMGVCGPALAQLEDRQREYYGDWLSTATAAEDMVDEGTASNATLEAMRSQIVGHREDFLEARGQHSARIRTLESQIDALGPVPETGDEPDDIASLRASLNEQLDTLRVPIVVSEEAFNRANGLISEIDRIIRERDTERLLSRGPTPLNLPDWGLSLTSVWLAMQDVWAETVVAWNSDQTRAAVRQQAPVLVILILVGLLLLVRGRPWAKRLGAYLRGYGGRGTGVWSFIVSLARIVIPLLGLILISAAIMVSGLVGLRGGVIVTAVPEWGATFLLFKWLADQSFPRHEPGLDPVESKRRSELRFITVLMSVMLILKSMLSTLEEIAILSESARAILAFPVILGTAILLLWFQRAAARRPEQSGDAGDDTRRQIGLDRVMPSMRRILVLMGVASPVLAVFGYGYAAEAIVFPAVLTLALIGLGRAVQQFFADLYGWLSGKGEDGKDSLFVVLVGFGIAVLSLPILALIWGARLVDLTELWTRFLEGFTVGDTRVSPIEFLKFALIFAIGYSVTRLVQGALRGNLLPKTSIDPGGQNAIVSGTGYIGIFLAAVIAITGAGLDLSSLAIVAGALSVGIGFGLQTIVSNFVSGIILLIERPVSKGDWIEVGGLMGYVRDISVRSTRIETFDRTDVIIPNSDLISGTVTNYTRGNTIGRVIVPVGVAYGSDTKKIEAILQEIANAHPMVLTNPPPNVVFQGFGADSLDFEIRAILRDVNWVLSVKSDMNHEIARRFAAEGVEIPFAQRDLWLRNPEALPGAAAFAPSARHNFSVDQRPDDTEKETGDDK